MKNSVIAFALILIISIFISGAYADNEKGLSQELLRSFENSVDLIDHDRSVYNAITNNDIKKLALNRDLVNSHNTLFSHKIKAKGITAQNSSGRCWLFAGLNTLRPKMIKKYKLDEFEFSEIYLTFYDKLEKANTFLEYIIATRDRDYFDREVEFIVRHPFGDGGYWDYVVDLVEKYGLIPKDKMAETHNSNNTSMMNRLISRKLRNFASELRQSHGKGADEKTLRNRKLEMMEEIYRMLVLNFGQPPKEFSWRYEDRDTVLSKPRTYTPHSFYKDAVGLDLKDYIVLVDHPAQPRNKYYTMLLTRGIYDQDDINFINLDTQQLKDLALESVLDDEPVWFACDVGKEHDSEHGILAKGIYDYSVIYDTDFELTKEERLLLRDSAPGHAMVMIGVDVVDEKPAKWLIENSWGSKRGDNGRWTMYDEWFDEYVYEVIIHKKYIPKDILKLLETEPTVLPPWDPLWETLRVGE
ncbi:MAG: C1 family peptidase [candidate division Zixibacteria bacterium]|nr:C1 family peptidase [candidate division Zixibacteria bacterium]